MFLLPAWEARSSLRWFPSIQGSSSVHSRCLWCTCCGRHGAPGAGRQDEQDEGRPCLAGRTQQGGQKAPRDRRSRVCPRPSRGRTGHGVFLTDLHNLFPAPNSLAGESLSSLVGLPSFPLVGGALRRYGWRASPSPSAPSERLLSALGFASPRLLRI